MIATATKTRLQFNHILFATDFSPAANRAVPFARAFAKHYDADVIALHVAAPMVNPMTQPAAWHAALEAEKVQNEERRVEMLAEFAGIPTKALVQEGDILSNVEKSIEKNDADLLVIGTHGRTGLAKFVLGSVAEEIFRSVKCPVLTVGPHTGKPCGAEIKEILFATDLSPESKTAAAYAVSLAQEFQARLVLLHIVEEPKIGDLVTAAEVRVSSTSLMEKLLPPGAELWCKPEYVFAEGDIAARILNEARERGSDLIVMGVKPEEGLPGAATHLPFAAAHKVVCGAPCPVLAVRH